MIETLGTAYIGLTDPNKFMGVQRLSMTQAYEMMSKRCEI